MASFKAMFDQLLQSGNCGIFAKDRNARFVGANAFLTRTAGFSHSDDLFGKSDDDMPWAADFDREAEQEVMCSGKIAHNIQRIQGKDRSFFAHTIKLPIYEKNTIVGLVGVLIPLEESGQLTRPAMTVALSYCPRVLVAEDSLLMHQVVKSLLTELSCIVTIVESGDEAIAKVQTNHYDLVFMDMGLPDRKGYESAKTIRSMYEGKAPPVIGLTTHITEEILAQCDAVGIKDVFLKPLMRDKVISVLSQYVYGRAYSNEASREALSQKREVLYADPEILDLVTSCVKLGGQFAMNEYFRMLCAYLPEWLIAVRDLCDKRRLGDLSKELHKGKGVLSFITAPKLQYALEALSLRSRGRSQETIDSLYATLSDEVETLIALFYRLLTSVSIARE